MNKGTLADLQRSGLTGPTIDAAGIQDVTDNPLVGTLLARLKLAQDAGYQIPYPGTKHYRLRILHPKRTDGTNLKAKYLQPGKSTNKLYIPPMLNGVWKKSKDDPLFITEGEKKALAGVQQGLTVVGLGGVWSWRVKDEDVGDGVLEEFEGIRWVDRDVYLVFDSDQVQNANVADAQFALATELEGRGARVQAIILPQGKGGIKVGLDDFLLHHSAEETLQSEEWLKQHAETPLPESPKWYVQQLLNGQSERVTRKTHLKVSHVAIRCLDSWGRRYKDAAGNYYYFDGYDRSLHEFRVDNLSKLRETTFGQFLGTELGLSTADHSVMERLVGDYTQGDCTRVQPHRGMWASADGGPVYFQLSNSRVARVSKEGVEFVDNGTDDVLFLAESVVDIDEADLAEALEGEKVEKRILWQDALDTLNIEPMPGLTRDATRDLLTALMYISPWLNRWRGLQPPLELAIAEPGSGKTFLYNLRMGVLVGDPSLGGLPDDLRGWIASVAASPGLWVCDNLNSVRSDYWALLNSELARVLTDPHPTVGLRQLYTTNSLNRIPIHSAFAVTAIRNPFTNPDVLQRSIVYQLRAIDEGKRDSDWYDQRLVGKGRARWLAQHLAVLQRFLAKADKVWEVGYLSSYRLKHFEQALRIMGEVLGLDLNTVIQSLGRIVAGTVAEGDPMMEALVTFKAEWDKGDEARLRDITTWADIDVYERFTALKNLKNVILLGRYVKSHTYDIEQVLHCKIRRPNNVVTLKFLQDEPETALLTEGVEASTVRPSKRGKRKGPTQAPPAPLATPER